MLSRFLILLFILVLSSVIWWPGLNDAPSFEHLSDLHLKDTQQKIGSMVESVIPVIDSVQAKLPTSLMLCREVPICRQQKLMPAKMSRPKTSLIVYGHLPTLHRCEPCWRCPSFELFWP